MAARKVASLLGSGADVTVISPVVNAALAKYSERKQIKHVRRKYRKGDLKNAFLVISATSDEQVNREVSLDARCLLNVVDAPYRANFIVPAVVNRGPLTLAVSTSGASPALAKSIREELESFYGKEFGRFADFLGRQRKKAMRGIAGQIAGPEMVAILREKGFERTKEEVMEKIKESRQHAVSSKKVGRRKLC